MIIVAGGLSICGVCGQSVYIALGTRQISGYYLGVVVNNTQSDSIQYLNFAKKWFIQFLIQYCFTQDSIQNIIQFKINSDDSIQKIIQFNSQGIIGTGQIRKNCKKCPKQTKGDFLSKSENID